MCFTLDTDDVQIIFCSVSVMCFWILFCLFFVNFIFVLLLDQGNLYIFMDYCDGGIIFYAVCNSAKF